MELLAWLGTVVLFAIGLLGTLLPVVPGAIIILGAAIVHRLIMGAGRSVSWWIVAVLVGLTILSYAVEWAAGYFGAKRFGATKWGAFGAVVGAVVGIFFGLPGIFIGPVVGAVAIEFIAGRRLIAAGKAGWGTLLGNVGGMMAKLLVALAMIVIFLLNAPSPF